MSVRPPRQFSPQSYANASTDPLTAALDYEILQEKAGTLGRLGRALEAALANLRNFETTFQVKNTAGEPLNASSHHNCNSHQQLKKEAAQALWYVVIQREICGLPTNHKFFDQYDIPAEVRVLMGSGSVLNTVSGSSKETTKKRQTTSA
ncbi:MAG: hypothetical protein ABJN26_28870 [Stappiaceae bacterium]